MTRRLLTSLGALTLGASAVLGLGASASAQPLDVRTAAEGVQQVTVGGSSQLVPLVVDRLAPGMTVTARFEVNRGTDLSGGEFASEIVDVQDFENGCGHSEAADGDVTCGSGAGQGELSSELRIDQRWWAPSPDCASTSTTASGPTLAEANEAPVTASDATNNGDTACLELVVGLPVAADNLVQSDSSRFALNIGLVDDSHPGDLTLGSGTIAGIGRALPLTGLDFPGRLTVAAIALLSGALMLLASRRPTVAG